MKPRCKTMEPGSLELLTLWEPENSFVQLGREWQPWTKFLILDNSLQKLSSDQRPSVLPIEINNTSNSRKRLQRRTRWKFGSVQNWFRNKSKHSNLFPHFQQLWWPFSRQTLPWTRDLLGQRTWVTNLPRRGGTGLCSLKLKFEAVKLKAENKLWNQHSKPVSRS